MTLPPPSPLSRTSARPGLLLVTVLLWLIPALPPASLVQARQIPIWTYEQLKAQSDLVVVARWKETRLTGQRHRLPSWETRFAEAHSSLTILMTIKGTAPEKNLQLVHYQLPKGKLMQNGPGFLQFRKGPLTFSSPTHKTSLGQADYLLFLKRGPGQHFLPVTGQIDANLSVRELYQPLLEPTRLDDDPEPVPDQK